MSLGLEPGTVCVVPYDPGWPATFAAERARLLELVGPDLPLALEHIGSTAIAGLPAKPVIDVLGGFPDGAPVAPFVAALRRAGYDHRGPNGIPGREYFRRGSHGSSTSISSPGSAPSGATTSRSAMRCARGRRCATSTRRSSSTWAPAPRMIACRTPAASETSSRGR